MQRSLMLVLLLALALPGACGDQKDAPVEANAGLCSGTAVYTARSGFVGVTLSASIELPMAGYTVKLVQRPERIRPPMYDLTCVAPGGGAAEVVTPYTASVTVPGASVGDELKVHDASGVHTVEVVAEPQPSAVATDAAPAGATCGGIAGVQCPDGQYCAMPAGQCGVADRQGNCAIKPEICTQDYQPVCGCDRQTYSNACRAAAAGVNVGAPGECPKSTG